MGPRRMDYEEPKRLDYSSMQAWVDAWEDAQRKKRLGNVPTWAEREGADPIMTGHEYDEKVSDATKGEADRRAYLDTEEKMFPRAPADFSGYDTAENFLTENLAGYSGALAGIRERNDADTQRMLEDMGGMAYGPLRLGEPTRLTDAHKRNMERSEYDYARQRGGALTSLANLSTARTTAEENARRFGIGQDRADTARYDQLKRWKEELELRKLSGMTPKQRDLYDQGEANKRNYPRGFFS